MADNFNIEDIIACEGRFTACACNRWPAVTVANIDFELLYGNISAYTAEALRIHEPFRCQYTRTAPEIDEAITHEINQLAHQALNELWNRLRIVAETNHSPTRTAIFVRKAPTVEGFVLHRFFASMLSGIGPLRIVDTMHEVIVICAPSAIYSNNYGRAAPTVVETRALNHIQRAFHEINLPTASIQTRGSVGSFFTTTFMRLLEADRLEVVGYMHYSHYTHSDVIMAMLLSDPVDDENPYEDLSVTVGLLYTFRL